MNPDASAGIDPEVHACVACTRTSHEWILKEHQGHSPCHAMQSLRHHRRPSGANQHRAMAGERATAAGVPVQTRHRDSSFAVGGDSHFSLAPARLPDPPGPRADAQAQRNRGLADDAQNRLETLPSACQMNRHGSEFTDNAGNRSRCRHESTSPIQLSRPLNQGRFITQPSRDRSVPAGSCEWETVPSNSAFTSVQHLAPEQVKMFSGNG